MTARSLGNVLAILAFAGAVALSAQEADQTSQAPAQAPTPAAAGDSSYIIGVGDLLKASVWKNPDLQAEVPVRPDGRISVPLVGAIGVEGCASSGRNSFAIQRNT